MNLAHGHPESNEVVVMEVNLDADGTKGSGKPECTFTRTPLTLTGAALCVDGRLRSLEQSRRQYYNNIIL
jgi:hypothetical protein